MNLKTCPIGSIKWEPKLPVTQLPALSGSLQRYLLIFDTYWMLTKYNIPWGNKREYDHLLVGAKKNFR